MDLASIKDDLAIDLKMSLEGLIEGADEDILRYATELAEASIAAASIGDFARLGEVANQAKVLAELHRIRVSNAGWDMVERVALTAARVLATAITAA